MNNIDPTVPETARQHYQDMVDNGTIHDHPDFLVQALMTLAGLHVEDKYEIIDWENVDGAYETQRYQRLYSDWVPVDKD